jgi:hypothetical protein
LAFKQRATEGNWFASEPIVDLKIRKRIAPTTSGDNPFKFFDGATMKTYRYAPKGSEVVFCRRLPMPDACKDGHGFDPEKTNIPISSLEAKPSKSENDSDVAFYAPADIPRMSYVGLEKLVHTFQMDSSMQSAIKEMKEHWASKGRHSDIFEPFGHAVERSAKKESAFDPASDRQVQLDPRTMTLRDFSKGEKVFDKGAVGIPH